MIHHSHASFGIIVSRGGFSKGAMNFARDKPILFLDISDLIAMQDGRDVLANVCAVCFRKLVVSEAMRQAKIGSRQNRYWLPDGRRK